MPWGFLQLNKEPEDSNDLTKNASNANGTISNAGMSQNELNASLGQEQLERLQREQQELLKGKRN